MSSTQQISIDIQEIEDKSKSIKVEGNLAEEKKKELNSIAEKNFDASIEDLAKILSNIMPLGSSITFCDNGHKLQLTKQ